VIKNNIIRFLCIVCVGVVLIFASIGLLGKYGVSGKNISPNGEYQVFQNRIAGDTTIRNLKTGWRAYVYPDKDKEGVFLWSPDSQYIAITYTSYEDIGANRFLVLDGDWIWTTWGGGMGEVVDISKTQFKIIRFVDAHSVLVEFVTEQEDGEKVYGDFVFDVERPFDK